MIHIVFCLLGNAEPCQICVFQVIPAIVVSFHHCSSTNAVWIIHKPAVTSSPSELGVSRTIFWRAYTYGRLRHKNIYHLSNFKYFILICSHKTDNVQWAYNYSKLPRSMMSTRHLPSASSWFLHPPYTFGQSINSPNLQHSGGSGRLVNTPKFGHMVWFFL